MSRCRVVCLIVGLPAVLAGCGVGGRGALSQLRPVVDRVERQRLADAGAPDRRDDQPGASFRLQPGPNRARFGSAPLPRFSLVGFQPADDGGSTGDVGAEARPIETRPGGGPLPGFWDTLKRDLRDMPGDLWADTKAVYTSPTNLVILGLTYGGALALQQGGPDDTVEASFAGGQRTFKGDWLKGFDVAGNPGTHFALAGIGYLIGQQAQDEKTYDVSKTLFSALIINGLSTLVGQAASWDRGPNGGWGTLPSGHTSSSFTFASVMHQAYGHWVGFPLYALSGLVAYERLEDGEHYLSDVIMGSVLGLVIGHTVAGEHELELFGGKIVPYADPYGQSTGVAWVKHFK
ncbi:MAG: phosphatase PAP2 family protein [Planctomycetes bacterium]|nr:phosphatase PAP2 family protein [Planctomycetota bacterium]